MMDALQSLIPSVQHFVVVVVIDQMNVVVLKILVYASAVTVVVASPSYHPLSYRQVEYFDTTDVFSGMDLVPPL